MKLLWVLIILHVAIATNDNSSSKEYLNPSDAEDKAFIWENLFIKLNTLLGDTDRLAKGLADVNQRLDELSKRQDDHETRLSKLMDIVYVIRVEEKKRDEGQVSSAGTVAVNDKGSIDAKLSQQWTTILRRKDGSVGFNRNWNDYKIGFGDPDASFFIGLERMHAMTSKGSPQELLIVLIDFDNVTRYAYYDLFRIGSEAEKYAMDELGVYAGDAGDGMHNYRGKSFTTFDNNNIKEKSDTDCPKYFEGGWWFTNPCYNGYLNGPYRLQKDSANFGVSWDPWRRWNYSLKYAAMMIRPKL